MFLNWQPWCGFLGHCSQVCFSEWQRTYLYSCEVLDTQSQIATAISDSFGLRVWSTRKLTSSFPCQRQMSISASGSQRAQLAVWQYHVFCSATQSSPALLTTPGSGRYFVMWTAFLTLVERCLGRTYFCNTGSPTSGDGCSLLAVSQGGGRDREQQCM